MTEQTPNEPYPGSYAEVLMLLHERDRTIAALRARPTLDRGPLTNTEEIKLYHVIEKVVVDELHVHKLGASDEVTSAAVDWFNSAILAAVGQDTPEAEWTDPEPWLEPATGARFTTELADYSGYSRNLRSRTRAQYDAEQGT